MDEMKLPNDGSATWVGMGDYRLVSADELVAAEISYIGEPPHGDSYHALHINGKKIPGFAWGCMFGFSKDSRYLICSWMKRLFERRTIVIDCRERKYFVLPEYFYNFSVNWPKISGIGGNEGSYEFSGREVWSRF